jgi:Ca2+-binding RTX toxin-like protein
MSPFRLLPIAVVAALLVVPAVAAAQDTDPAYVDGVCAAKKSGEQCAGGDNRKTPGGGNTGNVSHKGWPAISGVLWKVNVAKGSHRLVGADLNDELLGHHGNDTVIGNAGKDVLWGDWELAGNGSGQSDTLRGGDGNDFLYPSHGKNNMYGGDGNDRIIAYYGHGLIDCGDGTKDYAQTRWQSSAYKVRNCEHIRHFCAFGSKPNGDCKKPGEDALAVLSRQDSQSALLARLDAW